MSNRRQALVILASSTGLFGLTVGSAARADSMTDFFRAIDRDDVNTVDALLRRGFPASARDARGVPALVAAVRVPSPQVVQRLLAAPDVDLDAANPAGETALMLAALQGHADLLRRLADRGASMVGPTGWTALHYAASSLEPEGVAVLLTRGAAIDAQAPNGNTPLMMAARYGDERNVDLLLARRANVHLLNRNGSSAVEMAQAAGRDALARRLAVLYATPR